MSDCPFRFNSSLSDLPAASDFQGRMRYMCAAAERLAEEATELHDATTVFEAANELVDVYFFFCHCLAATGLKVEDIMDMSTIKSNLIEKRHSVGLAREKELEALAIKAYVTELAMYKRSK